jgi:EAL domain-containing protein (putative c-di-GMP-specific phosphodiesterase class I)/FixJ family two-component response regulator
MTEATSLKRILIFDDDSDFRKLLLIRLRKMFDGVDLEEYDPIADGVPGEDFNWAGYDVLLLDYYLCIHGVTGLDILHRNRKNPDFPATIMLTGAGNEEIAVHALKSGVSDYMRKEKLDKEELRKSILKAFEEQKDKRKKKNDATLHGQAFNKAKFYEQLDKPNRDTNKRILLIMQLDAHEKIAEGAGIIVRDNVVRHLAKQSFEVFRMGECNPNITRYNESSIALLIDDPSSQETLEFNMRGLCKHLEQRPYKFHGKKFRFSVSIGVLALSEVHEPAAVMTDMGNQAANAAAASQGENSYVYYNQLQPAEVIPSAPAEVEDVLEKTIEEDFHADTQEVSSTTLEPTTITEPYLNNDPETSPVSDAADEESAVEADLKPAPASPAKPEPVAAEPEPAKPEPVAAEPAPAKPEPVAAEPEPAKPEPVAAEPEPAKPEPVAVEPEPAKPEPVAVEPEPAKPEPVAAEPAPAKPEPVAAEPAPAKPEPVAAEPAPAKPEPVAAAPAPAKPEPVAAAPAPAKPEPVAAAPAPAKVESIPAVEKKEEKAPAAKPVAPAAAPAPAPKKKAPVPESDESILDGAGLNIAALEVKRSFEEKRVIQNFQPVISFVAEEEEASEIYSISLQMFEADGSHSSADEILSRVGDVPAFLKYIDRWMLREAIGRAVNSSQNQYIFIMKISDASLADATLFNWLRQLLSGLEKSHPGRAIALEISGESFAAHKKPAEALMAYLRKSHGFKFMLAHVEEMETLKTLTQKTDFDFLKISPAFVKQLSEEPSGDTDEGGTVLSNLKNRGANIIVKDVEDATTLTEVISVGADFAMGEFIGEATTQLDDSTNVESFDIS